MHISATELDVMPSAVAGLAIVGAYLNVRSASRSQLQLVKMNHERDRRTDTYIDMLKGVHLRNAQLDDTYTRPIAAASRTPTRSQLDPTSEQETLFAARLMAYASPEVDELWGEFARLTTEFDNYMIALRASTGLPPSEVQGPAKQHLEAKFDAWRQCRDKLKDLVRRELR